MNERVVFGLYNTYECIICIIYQNYLLQLLSNADYYRNVGILCINNVQSILYNTTYLIIQDNRRSNVHHFLI